MKAFITILLFIFTTLNNYADGGRYYEGRAGMLIPSKDTDVSMEEETIDIKIDKIIGNVYKISYNCEFYFKNNSKKNISILMGFPFQYPYRDIAFRIVGEDEIRSFRVLIDNNPAKFERYIHGFNPRLEEMEGYDEVYGFNVDFKPEEIKRIIICYETIKASDNYGSWELETSDHIQQYTGVSFDLYMSKYLVIRYILKSALTWKLPIKKAKIIVSCSFPVSRQYSKYNNFKSAMTPHPKAEFTYEDYYPDEDFFFVVVDDHEANAVGQYSNSYEERLYQLLEEYKKKHDNLTFGNIITLLLICEKNMFIHQIPGETMASAKSVLNSFFELKSKSDKKEDQKAFIWALVIMWRYLSEYLDRPVLEQSKAREKELLSEAISERMKRMEKISRVLGEYPADLSCLHNSVVLASDCNSLIEPHIYQEKYYGFLVKYKRSVKNYYESFFKDTENVAFLTHKRFFALEQTMSFFEPYPEESYNTIDDSRPVPPLYLNLIKRLIDRLAATKKTEYAENLITVLLYTEEYGSAPHIFEWPEFRKDPKKPKDYSDVHTYRKAYCLAGDVFRANGVYIKAIRAYKMALHFVRSNQKVLTEPYKLLEAELSKWEQETDEPAGMIAYNIARSYSRDSNIFYALVWLEIALRLRPGLAEFARSDKELEELRNGKTKADFDRLVNAK